MNVPLTETANVSHHDLESGKVQGGYRIECNIEKNQRPLEESIGCISWILSVSGTLPVRNTLTTSDVVHLVLYKEINQGKNGAKESTSEVLPIPDGIRMRWTQSNATKSPRYCKDEIRDHEDVVPVVVIGRGDVSPSSTGESSE